MPIEVSGLLNAIFWTYVDKGRGDSCWTWTGPKTHNGYGQFHPRKHVLHRAHRYAWTMANQRQIPDGMMVLHECDNRACVRASHLKLGTAAENTADMLNKSRNVPPPLNVGEKMWKAKLTANDVRAIRALRSAGGVSLSEIGRRFGVTKQAVTSILARRCWKHVA